MPQFSYIAVDVNNNQVKGNIEGENETKARAELRNAGLYVTNIVQMSAAAAKPKKKWFRLRTRFTSQFPKMSKFTQSSLGCTGRFTTLSAA